MHIKINQRGWSASFGTDGLGLESAESGEALIDIDPETQPGEYVSGGPAGTPISEPFSVLIPYEISRDGHGNMVIDWEPENATDAHTGEKIYLENSPSLLSELEKAEQRIKSQI